MARVSALLIILALVACSPRPEQTPLPTKRTTIDRAQKSLDRAAEDAKRRAEQLEAATK